MVPYNDFLVFINVFSFYIRIYVVPNVLFRYSSDEKVLTEKVVVHDNRCYPEDGTNNGYTPYIYTMLLNLYCSALFQFVVFNGYSKNLLQERP